MKPLIIIFSILLNSFAATACTCIMYPIESYVGKVDVIFTGSVIEILESVDTSEIINYQENKEFYQNKGYRVKVQVTEIINSKITITDTLEFTSDYSNCDPLYSLGESYLFFANKESEGKFMMRQCTYWDKLSNSEKNIRKLKKFLQRQEKKLPPTPRKPNAQNRFQTEVNYLP